MITNLINAKNAPSQKDALSKTLAVFIQGLATNHFGLLSIINDIISILLIFVTLNATTHFIICIGISKQYRNAVRELLEYEKPAKAVTITAKSSVASIAITKQLDVRRS
ncbi:hypothetical protein L5515_006417 [Caenorhabditis briggsae]|uniref:Uncharacterized protein n=1 Tax=Caenorhabditis briggsae TaxID=6238 RepID=A0AAE9JJH7_CAEBR|nr:hypothetical protein L5515_006417 [Caenorhabditis briggsae]